MQKFYFHDLIIEVFSDDMYSLNSVDNVNTYDYIYKSYDNTNDAYVFKYGLEVKNDENVLASCILVSVTMGATAPHERSALVDGNDFVIIIGLSIFSLQLPSLNINWKTLCASTGTCFEIYKCIDGYIIHGELSILKISKLGQIMWEFFGSDIFTTLDGTDDFRVFDDFVLAQDWENNTYKLDITDGKELT